MHNSRKRCNVTVWADVKPLISSVFPQLTDVQVIIFEPLSQTSTG
ncbi:MAG: hypothetical protein V7K25_27590 [Nostoc sp.]